ncbi:MAG TPA: hypothetical protein PKE04_15610, partial [Clostridia bacterium]|nr:hypothetical protein [Clostridia bacterium]
MLLFRRHLHRAARVPIASIDFPELDVHGLAFLSNRVALDPVYRNAAEKAKMAAVPRPFNGPAAHKALQSLSSPRSLISGSREYSVTATITSAKPA